MRSGDGINYQPDQKIWRYMRLGRFLEMLETSNFHFASANQFDDSFEGAVAIQPFDFPVDPRYSKMDSDEKAFAELKRLTKISCWHIEDHESAAMWQLYSGRGKGVAIVSTPAKIDHSLTPYRIKPNYGTENLWGGNVRYVDLMQERLNVGMLERFYFKHNAFSLEREFRCAISVRVAEEFGVRVPEHGIFVQANLTELIEEVHVGPSLKVEEREQVVQACKAHRLDGRVHITSLLGRPRYL
ncbi:MAG: DUF2971 domain-containing protein [Candidatus Ratteibacteria bacterium]|jgi:hypothetical protein